MQRRGASTAIAAALSYHSCLSNAAGARAAAAACGAAAPWAATHALAAAPLQRAPWAPRAYSAPSTGGGSGSGSPLPAADEAVDKMMKAMEAMMGDPAAQQLLLSRMPPHMRRPEVLKAMMANPEVRQRIAALAQQTGLHEMLGSFEAERISAGIDATRKAGVDPGALFARFMSSPSLALKLRDPHVLAAMADVVQNGPKALEKYSGDKAVVEAWNEASEILSQLQQADDPPGPARACGGEKAPGGGGAAPRSAQQSAAAEAAAALGARPEDLIARAMARPDLMEKVKDPEVQKALVEISQSPWKAVKYLLNRKVMGALKEIKNVLQDAHTK